MKHQPYIFSARDFYKRNNANHTYSIMRVQTTFMYPPHSGRLGYCNGCQLRMIDMSRKTYNKMADWMDFDWIRHRVIVLDRLEISLPSPEGANVNTLSDIASSTLNFPTLISHCHEFVKRTLTVWSNFFLIHSLPVCMIFVWICFLFIEIS